jgi:hypothetical protein
VVVVLGSRGVDSYQEMGIIMSPAVCPPACLPKYLATKTGVFTYFIISNVCSAVLKHVYEKHASGISKCYRGPEAGHFVFFKGTVAPDFLPTVFPMRSTFLGPRFTTQNLFVFCFNFVELFYFMLTPRCIMQRGVKKIVSWESFNT